MIKQLSAHGVIIHVKPKPSRAICERIGKEVAVARGITFNNLLNSCTAEAKDARALAWARIVEEVGCSAEALALAWGVDRTTIVDGLARARRQGQWGRAA